MEKFKVSCTEDNHVFVPTSAFSKLCQKFRSLKIHKGRIIHIVGSPGTGKSSNIYHAKNILGLNTYDIELNLKSENVSPLGVYKEFINTLKRDFNVETRKEAYNKLSEFDIILFADKLLDSENPKKKIGLTHWLMHNRLKSIILYLIVFYEILKHIMIVRKINMIFHTTWTFIFRGKKYDILSDFSILSIFLKGILKIFFEVVEIEYTEEEVIKIVKSHFEGIDESQIRALIRIYGRRPRYILKNIEDNLKTLKLPSSNISSIDAYVNPKFYKNKRF